MSYGEVPPRHRSRRRAPSEEVSDAEMSYGEVPPRQDAESLIRGAANRAAPGSAGEEDEEMYDDDRSSDASDYSYDDDDDSGESGWYYEDREEEEEQEGAGGDRACGSAEEEAASAGVGGGPKAEGSAQGAVTCCICMDPWAPYGAHRICCIPCGHVYGRSCLERWLLGCGNVSAKCPTCSERFKHMHIINLYRRCISGMIAASKRSEPKVRVQLPLYTLVQMLFHLGSPNSRPGWRKKGGYVTKP
ncbi:hypothetical protein ZWY2020_051381 [Hordeum vulgare]|nr:hypothetical protein ZWY2020_051381 [Hordeum vulgare]